MGRLLILLTILLSFSLAKEVSFTQEDRERLRSMEIRIEKLDTKVDMGFQQIDKRFEQMEKQIDRLTQIMIAIFGGQLLLIATIIGLILWDRKSTVKRATDEALEKFEKGKFSKLLDALKDLANEDEKLYRVLKKYNLL
ncbi:MAG: hypothetical protein WKI50_02055 [Aquificaceae bacterium]